MSEAIDKQAENALEYLRICVDVEQGNKFDDDSKSRGLTADERNVKEAALTALLDYFVSDPDRKAPDVTRTNKRKRQSQPERSKTQ